MKNTIVNYLVKKDKTDEALILISEFISQIRLNEPGTVIYKSYQETQNPSAFMHIMSFKDEKAEKIHYSSDYVREFTERLSPICEKEPVYTEIDLAGTI